MYTLNIKLAGLTCEACVKLAKRMIGKIEGVKETNIQLAGNAEIIAERLISKSEIKDVLSGSDYQVI